MKVSGILVYLGMMVGPMFAGFGLTQMGNQSKDIQAQILKDRNERWGPSLRKMIEHMDRHENCMDRQNRDIEAIIKMQEHIMHVQDDLMRRQGEILAAIQSNKVGGLMSKNKDKIFGRSDEAFPAFR